MKLKEFKLGQKVCIMRAYNPYAIKTDIPIHTREATVEKIGKKYLYTNTSQIFEEREELKDRLVEAKDWGDRDILFLSQKAAEEYCEREKLIFWFSSQMARDLNKCSLDVLASAKRILVNDDKNLLTSVKQLIDKYNRYIDLEAADEYQRAAADTLTAVIQDLKECLK